MDLAPPSNTATITIVKQLPWLPCPFKSLIYILPYQREVFEAALFVQVKVNDNQ